MPGPLVLLCGMQAVYTERGGLYLQGLTRGPAAPPQGVWALHTAPEEFYPAGADSLGLPAFGQGV